MPMSARDIQGFVQAETPAGVGASLAIQGLRGMRDGINQNRQIQQHEKDRALNYAQLSEQQRQAMEQMAYTQSRAWQADYEQTLETSMKLRRDALAAESSGNFDAAARYHQMADHMEQSMGGFGNDGTGPEPGGPSHYDIKDPWGGTHMGEMPGESVPFLGGGALGALGALQQIGGMQHPTEQMWAGATASPADPTAPTSDPTGGSAPALDPLEEAQSGSEQSPHGFPGAAVGGALQQLLRLAQRAGAPAGMGAPAAGMGGAAQRLEDVVRDLIGQAAQKAPTQAQQAAAAEPIPSPLATRAGQESPEIPPATHPAQQGPIATEAAAESAVAQDGGGLEVSAEQRLRRVLERTGGGFPDPSEAKPVHGSLVERKGTGIWGNYPIGNRDNSKIVQVHEAITALVPDDAIGQQVKDGAAATFRATGGDVGKTIKILLDYDKSLRGNSTKRELADDSAALKLKLAYDKAQAKKKPAGTGVRAGAGDEILISDPALARREAQVDSKFREIGKNYKHADYHAAIAKLERALTLLDSGNWQEVNTAILESLKLVDSRISNQDFNLSVQDPGIAGAAARWLAEQTGQRTPNLVAGHRAVIKSLIDLHRGQYAKVLGAHAGLVKSTVEDVSSNIARRKFQEYHGPKAAKAYGVAPPDDIELFYSHGENKDMVRVPRQKKKKPKDRKKTDDDLADEFLK